MLFQKVGLLSLNLVVLWIAGIFVFYTWSDRGAIPKSDPSNLDDYKTEGRQELCRPFIFERELAEGGCKKVNNTGK